MSSHSRRHRAAAAISAVLAITGIGIGTGPVPSAAAPIAITHLQNEDPTSIAVAENEYTISVPGTLAPGAYTFEVTNTGHAPHDLVITGPGTDARTPTIAPGASAELTATLAPGSYEFWCSVPGHRALGMTTNVTVG